MSRHWASEERGCPSPSSCSVSEHDDGSRTLTTSGCQQEFNLLTDCHIEGGSFSGTKSKLMRLLQMPILEPPLGDTDPFIFSSCLCSANSFPPSPRVVKVCMDCLGSGGVTTSYSSRE